MPVLRYMTFVDGENLTIEGEKLLAATTPAKKLIPDSALFSSLYGMTHYHSESNFIWFPPGLGQNWRVVSGDKFPGQWSNWPVDEQAVRSYYYTSVVGAEPKSNEIKDALWRLSFEPVVFKKAKGNPRSKGVDIALTKDMLSQAYLDNYDVAILVSADADYVPVIEEVKRRGKRVAVVAFAGSTNDKGDLQRAADHFVDITDQFTKQWLSAIAELANR